MVTVEALPGRQARRRADRRGNTEARGVSGGNNDTNNDTTKSPARPRVARRRSTGARPGGRQKAAS